MRYAAAAPSMAYVFTIDVALQPPIVLAESPLGRRVYIPIVGGTVRGPRLQAEIIPGGGDRAVERVREVMDIHANYLVRTHDDVVIEVDNRGSLARAPGRVTVLRDCTGVRYGRRPVPMAYPWCLRGNGA